MEKIETREVRIVGKGRAPQGYKVIDVETGKEFNNVSGIHVGLDINDVAHVTIEQIPEEGPELDIQALATIKDNRHIFTDSYGRVWLNGDELVKMIRDKGVMCSSGGAKSVSCEFTEVLLKEWETPQPAPREGQTKET